MSNTHLSPRQDTEGLALWASNANSGLRRTLQPEQLELMVRLLEKDVSPVTLGGKRRWLGCSCALDDKNPDRFNLRHVALAFQQYSKKKKLIAENDEERQRRLSVCTTIIGAVVGKVMSDYKERWSLFQMICLSGVRGLQTAILMVYWLSAVSGLRLSAMSLTKLPAAVTSLSP
ncbi:hypothetical protein WJX82_006915 [Trebouxia sp. C0006]